MPVYNNFLKEYRLGPNDVITIEVFGQCPDYCKTNIAVPPTARISYPLIREGVMVGGKTVEEVASEITKKLDEYIKEQERRYIEETIKFSGNSREKAAKTLGISMATLYRKLELKSARTRKD